MKKFLVVMVVLMLVVVCYGQYYEPEHIWHLRGEENGDWFGKYIAGVGDINRDGFEDFLASNKTQVTPTEGHMLLFHGGNPPDTIPDLIFNNPYSYGAFGYFIENIGDVNCDGYDDIAAQGGYSQDNIDRVFIFYGGLILDTIPDLELSEGTFEDVYGYNIEGIGDANGDGYDDVAVHASNYGGGRGKVWVYFGGSPMDSISDWEREGRPNNHSIFGQSISGGDLNGDDYDDFAVYEWTNYPIDSCTTYYIYFGGDQLDTIPDVIVRDRDYYPSIDLSNSSAIVSNLNGDPYDDLVIAAGRTCNAIVLHGGDPMDTEIDLILTGFDPDPQEYSMEVSFVGDVNGDGYGDIIASQSAGLAYGGLVVVYLGNPWMDGHPDMFWDCWDTQWQRCGSTLTNIGDVNGDGVDDIVFGALSQGTRGSVDIWAGDTAFYVTTPDEPTIQIPENFRLQPPYPNPFNSSLTIPFTVTAVAEVQLSIYNVLGQRVYHKDMGRIGAGEYHEVWDARMMGSGVYIVQISVGGKEFRRKGALLR